MKASKLILGMVVCAFGLSQVSWGQEAPADANEALGYLNYSTGVFRPVGQTEDFDSELEAAKTPQTGTFVVNFTITIKSAIPATSPIICGVTASVNDISAAGVNVITEVATVAGARTGNTAKCTVTIPYSWMVLNPAAAKVNLIYNLTGSKGAALTRSSSGSIASIPVPANGSTTTQAVNAVL